MATLTSYACAGYCAIETRQFHNELAVQRPTNLHVAYTVETFFHVGSLELLTILTPMSALMTTEPPF